MSQFGLIEIRNVIIRNGICLFVGHDVRSTARYPDKSGF
jgi:hypothetical protein